MYLFSFFFFVPAVNKDFDNNQPTCFRTNIFCQIFFLPYQSDQIVCAVMLSKQHLKQGNKTRKTHVVFIKVRDQRETWLCALKGELRCKMKIGMLKHHTELVCVLRSKIDLACCIQSLTIFYRLSQKANNGSGRCP